MYYNSDLSQTSSWTEQNDSVALSILSCNDWSSVALCLTVIKTDENLDKMNVMLLELNEIKISRLCYCIPIDCLHIYELIDCGTHDPPMWVHALEALTSFGHKDSKYTKMVRANQ